MSSREDTGTEMAGARRRPLALSWRTAAVVALCASAGSPVWGAVFLTREDPGEAWIAWVAKCAAAVLIASFFFEPMVRHLQAGRVPALFHPRFRSLKAAFQWVLVIVSAGLLAEAYRDGIFKSFDSVGEWGATSLIVALMMYAWLRAIDAPYVDASNRAEWLGALGALGFTLIGAAVDVYRISHGAFARELATWIDGSFMQWAIRLVLWGVIGRLGVWIVTRPSPAGLAARLMLAALAAGGMLEALIALSLWFDRTLAERWFNTTPGAVLLLYPIVTGFWCAGIWLATPRRGTLKQTPAPDTGSASSTRPRIAHSVRLGILCAAVTIVALSARLLASPPIPQSNARIEFFASNDPLPDPQGFHNLLNRAFPGDAAANRYVHAIVSVSHPADQRPTKITIACSVANSAQSPLMAPRELRVDLPDAVSRRGARSQTSWVVSFGGPDYTWQPGSYKVECRLPQGGIAGEFTLR